MKQLTIILGLIALLGCQKQDIQPPDPPGSNNNNTDVELVDVRWEIRHKFKTDYALRYAPYGVLNVYDTLYTTDSLVLEYQVEDTELNGPAASWIDIDLITDPIPGDTLWLTRYINGVFDNDGYFENGYGRFNYGK